MEVFHPLVTCQRACIYFIDCSRFSYLRCAETPLENISLHIRSKSLSVCDILEWTHSRIGHWTWKEKVNYFPSTSFWQSKCKYSRFYMFVEVQFLLYPLLDKCFSLYFLSIFEPISTADTINWFNQIKKFIQIPANCFVHSAFSSQINRTWIE